MLRINVKTKNNGRTIVRYNDYGGGYIQLLSVTNELDNVYVKHNESLHFEGHLNIN